jgi:hypothetical protein
MPVQLLLERATGSDLQTVWNDSGDQDFVFDTAQPLTGIQFDPDNWILKYDAQQITLADGDGDGVPDRNDNCPFMANPLQANLDGDRFGDVCDDDDDDDLLDDPEDCAPLDPQQGTPGEVALLEAVAADGAVSLSWSAAPRADRYDLSRGLLGQLHGGYGSCLVDGLAALSYEDATEPPAGDGFHYLVRGVDDGCGGAGTSGTDSAGVPRPSPCP